MSCISKAVVYIKSRKVNGLKKPAELFDWSTDAVIGDSVAGIGIAVGNADAKLAERNDVKNGAGVVEAMEFLFPQLRYPYHKDDCANHQHDDA